MKFALGAELALLATAVLAERFDERLALKVLPNRKVLAHWTFTTSDADLRQPHYTLFPLGLGQILTKYDVSELHLSLNAGQWDYDSWRTPPEQSVAAGAEMWAWLRSTSASAANLTTDIDTRWTGLRSAVAGVFCASLGKLDSQRTTVPDVSFRPSAPLKAGRHQLRHATLPGEIVCTENLTPFVKLLPCKASAGIASLLNPHVMFAAPFHGLSVHFAHGVLTLSAQIVFSTPTNVWSLQTMLGRSVKAACPVAGSSIITLDAGKDESYQPAAEARRQPDGTVHFDLQSVPLPFVLGINPTVDASSPSSHVVTIQRTITGSAQYNGGLLVNLQNNRNDTVKISYLETLPWFITLYLNTLDVRLDGKSRPDLLETLRYRPSIPGSTPSPMLLEPTLTIPPLSTLTLTCGMDRAFLLYTQHPPDAQRGWDLPPAVVTVLSIGSSPFAHSTPGQIVLTAPGRKGEVGLRTYAKTLLADLPTPDFSMPYNVIIMSSTLIALLFGNIFNLLSRELVIVQVDEVEADDKSS